MSSLRAASWALQGLVACGFTIESGQKLTLRSGIGSESILKLLDMLLERRKFLSYQLEIILDLAS
jgi:hypothetical protein